MAYEYKVFKRPPIDTNMAFTLAAWVMILETAGGTSSIDGDELRNALLHPPKMRYRTNNMLFNSGMQEPQLVPHLSFWPSCCADVAPASMAA